MAKKKYDSSEGIWRTIGGRRVFIKTGQSLSDAMKDSGKFKTKMNEKAVKGVREEDLKEQYKDSLNNVSKMEYNGEITKEEYDKAIKNINRTYIDKRNNYSKGERTYEQVDKEWTSLAKKMEKDYDEFGTTNWQDEKRLNELSLERDTLSIKDDKTSWDDEKYKEVYSKMSKENQNKINMLEEDMRKNPSSKNINEKQRQAQAIYDAEDKFYTRKDGTKEYDPYKGTRFEKKYDSVEDALNDPNHPTRKYINQRFLSESPIEEEARLEQERINANLNEEKVNRKLSRQYKNKEKENDRISKGMTKEEYKNGKYNFEYKDSINRVRNNRVVENIETGNKYYEVGNGQWRSEKDGYDYYIDFNSSNIDNPKFRDVASGRIINTNPRADNYWDYEGNGLKSKYKGTVDYLKQTTNMSGNEILELLKKIDEDKK